MFPFFYLINNLYKLIRPILCCNKFNEIGKHINLFWKLYSERISWVSVKFIFISHYFPPFHTDQIKTKTLKDYTIRACTANIFEVLFLCQTATTYILTFLLF